MTNIKNVLLTAAVSCLSSHVYAISEGELMPKVEIFTKDEKSKLDWQGKTAVINFWATWCDACKVELKEMNQEFAPLHEKKDVIVAYVSLDKDPSKAKKYLEQTFGVDAPVTQRVAYDSSFKAADELGIDSFPMTVVVGKDGKIVKIQRGFKEGAGSTAQLLKSAVGQ